METQVSASEPKCNGSYRIPFSQVLFSLDWQTSDFRLTDDSLANDSDAGLLSFPQKVCFSASRASQGV